MIEKGRLASASRSDKTLSLFPYESQRQLPELRVVEASELRPEWLSELTCSVCEKTLRRTKVTPCLHRFCAGCINGLRKCPTCSEPIIKKTLIKSDPNTDSIIGKFYLSPKRGRFYRNVNQMSHLFFSDQKTLRRWHNGVAANSSSNTETSPTTSSLRRSRPFKRQLDNLDDENDMKALHAQSSSNSSSAIVNSESGSSPLSTISELAAGTESTVANSSCISSTNRSAEECSKSKENQSSVFLTSANGLLQNGSFKSLLASQRTGSDSLDSGTSKAVLSNQKDGHAGVYLKDKLGQNQEQVPTSINETDDGKRSKLPSTSGCSTPILSAATGEGATNQPNSNVMEKKPSNSVSVINNTASSVTRHDSTQSSCAGIANSLSPADIFFLHRQHLCPGFETEVILTPDASVFAIENIPVRARRPYFIFCDLQAKVEHLCAFVLRRTQIAMNGQQLKKRVEVSSVKTEMVAKEVFVMNMTGEGRYSTVETCPPSEAESFRLFSLQYPFKALDEDRTVENLKEEFVGDKVKPLRVIYRFVEELV